jgi:RNA polymerase sigma factor (sigma-70 family)
VEYLSDEQILSELRRKNELALKALYKMHYPMIVNLVCSNNGTEQEAKDIYQDAVIVFYEKVTLTQLALSCKIKTYLFAVCRRLWLKRLAEKKKFQGTIDETESFADIDSEIAEIEAKEIRFQKMKTALNGLGEPCRSIIEDFYVQDLTMEAIKDKFGYTNADNAKNQKYKCLQRLKKLFFKEEYN